MPPVSEAPAGGSDGRSGAPAVASAIAILDILTTSDTPLTLAEITRAVPLPKSSAHRILTTLLEEGAVQRDGSNVRYALGPRLLGFARGYQEGNTRRGFASVANALVKDIDQTVQLAVLTGPDMTVAAYVDCNRPVRLATRIGRRLPVHATAAGKAALAYAAEAQVRGVLDAGLTRITARTITDPKKFRAHLTDVRERGWAIETEESTPNLCCVAAPVFGDEDQVFGALTVCVATTALSKSRTQDYAGRVIDAARQLSGTPAAPIH